MTTLAHTITRKLHKGFTLIELLVVIAIIGILSAVILVSLNTARAQADDSARLETVREVTTALEFYYSDHGYYPPLIDGSGTGGADGPLWSGEPCADTPSCVAWEDENWNNVISVLVSGQYLSRAEEQTPTAQQNWYERLAINVLSPTKLLFPKAMAASQSQYQDPDYPNERYVYMTSGGLTPKQYMVRTQLTNLSDPALVSSLTTDTDPDHTYGTGPYKATGPFLWYDYTWESGSINKGPDNCDTSLGFYCTSSDPNFAPFLPGKPVIYLYPTHTENVSVKLADVTVQNSIPSYDRGWSVLAHPNGDITSGNQTYPYLFWDGSSGAPKIDTSKGVVVTSADLRSTLASELAAQGLTASESKGFLDYWVPLMQSTGKPYYYVYFMPQSDYNQLVPMTITPTPDTVIRAYMLWKSLNAPISVTPQQFKAPVRNGFTVVEWGGDRSQIH